MFGWIVCYATCFVALNWLNHTTGLHVSDLVTAVVATIVAATVCYLEDRYHLPLK